jgi:hypothetical protein
MMGVVGEEAYLLIPKVKNGHQAVMSNLGGIQVVWWFRKHNGDKGHTFVRIRNAAGRTKESVSLVVVSEIRDR